MNPNPQLKVTPDHDHPLGNAMRVDKQSLIDYATVYQWLEFHEFELVGNVTGGDRWISADVFIELINDASEVLYYPMTPGKWLGHSIAMTNNIGTTYIYYLPIEPKLDVSKSN